MDLECIDQVCVCHKRKACDIVVIANHQVMVFSSGGSYVMRNMDLMVFLCYFSLGNSEINTAANRFAQMHGTYVFKQCVGCEGVRLSAMTGED
jgi:hypothetical protein